MRSPAVSVCMPVYNASRYLRECIDSILAQTFTDFELLIVDDGSTDGCRDIIRMYVDPRIRLIENRHDYIGTLNTLLLEARGKYIARMDADDVMLPSRLQVQFEYMEEHDDIGVLGTSAVLLGGTEGIMCEYTDKAIITHQDLLRANPLIHPTTMLRTSVLRTLGVLYEEKFKYAEDYRLWTALAMRHIGIAVISFVGIKYRCSDTQITHKHSAAMARSADKVKQAFAKWIWRQSNVSYRKPLIEDKGKMLTVIIPFLNEGYEVVETVKNLRLMVGNEIDILVINDFSTDELDYQTLLSDYNVYYVLNNKRMGVAASRDLGVRLCETPYFLLLDAHMRVYDNKWLEDMVAILKNNDRQILCAQTRQLWKNEKGKIVELKENAPVYGAYATFKKGELSPGIDWNYLQRDKEEKLQPIACILGAGYAASKRYWMYLRGLEGLKQYGCDEVYISLKVWTEGGKCVLLKKHYFGHLYRKQAPYQITQCSYVYNYLLIAYIVLPLETWCWALSCCKIAKPGYFKKAWNTFLRNKGLIDELKCYHSKISKVSPKEILEKNKLFARQQIGYLVNRRQVAEQIPGYILQHAANKYGIVEGKMAAMIWLSLWDKGNAKGTLDLRQKLYGEIKEAVLSHQLPLNFRNGLCGIGWGLLYLYAHKLLPDIDRSILSQIDNEIKIVNFTCMADKSLYYGTAGVVVYFVCREYFNRHKGLDSLFPNKFNQSICAEERNLLQHSNEHVAVYYSYLHKYIDSIRFVHDFVPQLEDWIDSPNAIPQNPKYWRFRMDDGCLGYTIPTFTDRTHNLIKALI